MSKRVPNLDGAERPHNLAVQLREAFVAVNSLVLPHLAEHDFSDIRPAHGNVFQYLDDTGTTVSTLAERADMTKQAMAELVHHLEQQGYVTREPDPHDGRAKLVLPTDRGRAVFQVAQELVPQVHSRVARLIGTARLDQLRQDLEAIRREFQADSDL